MPVAESSTEARKQLRELNREIADWTEAMGYHIVNFTPGTRSNADYTGEADANFVSSQRIVRFRDGLIVSDTKQEARA